MQRLLTDGAYNGLGINDDGQQHLMTVQQLANMRATLMRGDAILTGEITMAVRWQ
jgi:hypothetical protein